MKPHEYLELKAELLTEGVRATPEALSGLAETYKEQNHGLFGWDFEDHVGMNLPDDFKLPDSTIVQFRKNGRSPCHVIREEAGLTLYRGEEPVCDVEWLERPGYYTQTTSQGNPMVKVGQTGGEDCLFFCYQNYCSHFARDEQCLFCNLVSTSSTYDSVLRKKDLDDIGEVAKQAFSEGQVKHVLLTGGCFSHQKEVEMVGGILEAIRRHTGFERVPGTLLPSPATDLDTIKRYHETGIQAIGYSMEIWDERLFGAICPGKSATTSHTDFLKAIAQAVGVFGPGNVYGVFVMGLEPSNTFLEGVRALAGTGANVVPFVWSPNPGSRLEGHRAPTSSWYVDTIAEAAEIMAGAGVPAGTENHCYQCDGNSLLHDALRLKGIV